MDETEGIRYILAPTHISQIKAGDTILVRGNLRTVCKHDIKHDGFVGLTVWGDSYKGGLELVPKADIFHAKVTHHKDCVTIYT